MKKVFLALLCAGLFFACGNKKQAEAEPMVDSTACQPEMVVNNDTIDQEPAAEPQESVAETTTTTKKSTTTTKKTNNNNSGMTATKETQSVEDHAKQAANRVANKAIEKAETDATNTMVNGGKKKR